MKIAHLLNVQRIGCKSHRFALNVRAMLKSDDMVNSTWDAIHEKNEISEIKTNQKCYTQKPQ